MKENRPILRERDVINDRYKIVNLVGSGGYGTVYRAIDLDTRVYVALKAEKDSKNEQLKNESVIYKYLQQKADAQQSAFIPLLSIGEDPKRDVSYIALQFCGPDLRNLKKRTPYDRFSPHTTTWILHKIIEIFEFFHRKCKLIHRDIKPANFCIRCDLSGTRELKMIDFGLTKEATDGKALNGNVGTQRYSSINLMKGKHVYYIDDLWAVYYLSVENWNGTLPWRKVSDPAMMNKMKQQVYDKKFYDLSEPIPWFVATQKEPISLATIRIDMVRNLFDLDKYTEYKRLLSEELHAMHKQFNSDVKLDWEIKREELYDIQIL